ncbi:MAG: DNA polymerase III subunit gamma/tau [Lachnospiraceae bacterium]|jgi:DNA polymerase-3 subunit gamma/tau|nr:DNA polymerase III subunit gamma/tau [Lachnospiraceae bacterium]
MSYTALYRKFRPQCFEDVKGQDAIVTTLKNQIVANRVGHAYLFCGTRGTGKTSVAKIFARAVNCEQPVEGSPCGECSICEAIAVGASMNVMEIDAASNNGVDNIRDIVEEVTYSPAEGRYKVYIIDEVHMLSIGAFNALLKTLEEPPEYVIFILATTEVHKIPVTIMSRCQRYDFKRITVATITGRLKELMIKEQIEADDQAVNYIAKVADGAMRDALSLLDQCIAFYFGQRLTYDNVLTVLGAVDTEIFSRLLRSSLEGDVSADVAILEEIVMMGRELTQFVIDFTWYLRNLLLLKASADLTAVIDLSAENMNRLKEEAEMTDTNTIMRYIRIFSELSGQIRYAAQKRILIEMALIRLCKPEMEVDQRSLVDRIRSLENKIASGISVTTVSPDGFDQAEANRSAGGHEILPGGLTNAGFDRQPKLSKAIPSEVEKIVSNWSALLNRFSMPMKSYLKSARLSLDAEGRLMIIVEDGPASDYLIKQAEHQQQLEDILSEAIAAAVTVNIQSIAANRSFDEHYVDLTKVIRMEVEIEEEGDEY